MFYRDKACEENFIRVVVVVAVPKYCSFMAKSLTSRKENVMQLCPLTEILLF